MPPHTNHLLTLKELSFRHASINEIAKLLHASPNKQCDLDPIPSILLKQVSATILPIITIKFLPINRHLPHSSQAIPCYTTPQKPSLDIKKYIK